MKLKEILLKKSMLEQNFPLPNKILMAMQYTMEQRRLKMSENKVFLIVVLQKVQNFHSFLLFTTGSYEAAVESGVNKDIAMRRTKRILKIRKQDSYTRAIGGSFEDEHSMREERRKERDAHIRKQDSYLKAVGEVSPDTESISESISEQGRPGFRKHDSYIEAIR